MLYEKVYLHKKKEDIYFEMFCCEDTKISRRKRPTILVLPGGAYEFCFDIGEGGPIVRFFMSKGYNCARLNYSVSKMASLLMPKASRPLLEASQTVSMLRKNAEKWNVDTERIAVIGFSAGGHLAASLGTMWDDDSVYDNLKIPFASNKPNAMILCYPVIKSDEYAHRGSIDNLLGKYKDDKELLNKYDLTNQISDNTPPTFIWHTYTDDGVPVENSIKFCEEMRKKSKSSCELHVFFEGGHGMGLCTKDVGYDYPHVAKWTELCAQWLDKIFNS